MTVTRVRPKCSVPDCPWPFDEEIHFPWCAGIAGHKCFGGGSHQHRPRKGLGGNNPESKIVAIICIGMHRAVDQGETLDGARYKDDVAEKQGRRVYTIYRYDGGKAKPVLSKEIPDGSPGRVRQDHQNGHAPPAEPVHESDPLREGLREGDESLGDLGQTGVPAVFEGVSGLSTAAAEASELLDSELRADWSGRSDDDLQSIYEAASDDLRRAVLRKCKVAYTYRENHIQQWGKSWVSAFTERFGASRRTAEGYAGFWAAVLTFTPAMVERLADIAESRGLVQFIGRQSAENAPAVAEAAIDYVGEYGEPPTVPALHHKVLEERGEAAVTSPKQKLWSYQQLERSVDECPLTGQKRQGALAFVRWLGGFA